MNMPNPRRRLLVLARGLLPALSLAVVMAGVAVVARRRPLGPDVAWFLSVGRRMLAGESLYVDIIDVNPPLISYLMMPPGLIADWLSVSDFFALNLYTLAFAGWSGMTSLSLLDAAKGRSFNRSWWVIVLVVVLLILPGYDFGQREHLLVILSVPYLFLKWRRSVDLPTSHSLALMVGLAAGIGFALKPFFVALWLGLEITSYLLRVHRRPWRPSIEALAVGAVLGFYAAYALIVHHEYIVMMASVAGIYRDFGVGWRPVAIVSLMAVLPTILIAVAARGVPRSKFILATLLLIYGAIGAVLAIGQAKGWYYHFLPMLGSVVVLAGLLLEDHSNEMVEKDTYRQRGPHLVAMLVILIGLSLLGVVYRFEAAQMAAQAGVLDQRAHKVGRCDARSIVVMSETVSAAYPLVNQLRASSASPFPSMWWLRALYAHDEGELDINEPASMGQVEEWFHRLQVERFVRDAPELVLVNTAKSERFGGQRFPYIEYFSQDENFAAAWRHYRPAGSVGHLGMWLRISGMDPAGSAHGDSSSVERCAEGNTATGK